MSVTAYPVSDFEAERQRLARELHDAISYGFATISLQAGAAVHVADELPQQAREALEAITLASRTALEDLRGILGVLRRSDGSGGPEVGLEGLDALVETTTRAGVTTSLTVDGRPAAVPAAVDRAGYRIVQEALTNVLRHAWGSSATVAVRYEDGRVSIAIEDDGAGLETGGHVPAGSGFGILGMRERALALGGDLEAGPRPEGGFSVRAYLPVPSDS
jgi:signal transduction histidine kinase